LPGYIGLPGKTLVIDRLGDGRSGKSFLLYRAAQYPKLTKGLFRHKMHISSIHLTKHTVSFLLMLGLFVLCLRLPYNSVKFWTIDEAGFAAVANKLIDGHILYKDAYDNKPPFIYVFYAGVFLLFGKGNMAAVHMATLFAALLSLWLLFLLSAEMFSKIVAQATAAAYAFFLVASKAGDVFSAMTEIYMTPAIIAGVYFCCRGLRSTKNWHWAAAGISFGMAFWIKQPGILFCLMVPVVALIGACPFKPASLIQGGRKCLVAFLGFSAISLLWLIPIYRNKCLHEFIDIVILYNTKIQTASIPIHQSVRMALYTVSAYFKSYFAPIILALIGSILLIGRLRARFAPDSKRLEIAESSEPVIIMLAWSAISIVAVTLGGRFYGYYMYIVAPIIAILAAVAFKRFYEYRSSLAPLTRWSMIIFLIIGAAMPFYQFQSSYFAQANDFLARRDGTNMGEFSSTPALMVSRYIARTTLPRDQIFIWGYQPNIYVLSGRNFATRYFSAALQTGFVWGTIQQLSGWRSDYQLFLPGTKSSTFQPSDTAQWIYPGSQELLLHDLAASPPELFIDGNVPGEWPFGAKYPIASFSKFQEFLDNNYQFEKNILGYRIYRRLKATQQYYPDFNDGSSDSEAVAIFCSVSNPICFSLKQIGGVFQLQGFRGFRG
jgi:4-amino-4-deoxy-L-arabinose transferase-like glycosyltransferase